MSGPCINFAKNGPVEDLRVNIGMGNRDFVRDTQLKLILLLSAAGIPRSMLLSGLLRLLFVSNSLV